MNGEFTALVRLLSVAHGTEPNPESMGAFLKGIRMSMDGYTVELERAELRQLLPNNAEIWLTEGGNGLTPYGLYSVQSRFETLNVQLRLSLLPFLGY